MSKRAFLKMIAYSISPSLNVFELFDPTNEFEYFISPKSTFLLVRMSSHFMNLFFPVLCLHFMIMCKVISFVFFIFQDQIVELAGFEVDFKKIMKLEFFFNLYIYFREVLFQNTYVFTYYI